ncbi:zinc finger BED domain-containing protein RICESLEEPER 2-like [Salvia divinorum]|uniref:Zinc finger BED domain-containing protein RICESLEEPER 2-like n=1 Tax=Salvia divinorum TaxID=28513 RepID=A0ABD1IIL1_SALDI
MCTNIGAGSSSSLGDCGETGETPTLASETPQMLDDVGALAMEIVESPNLNTAKPPKPNLKRKQRSDVWNHYKVELDANGLKTCQCVYCGHKYLRISSKSGTGNMLRHLDNCPRKKTKDVGEILTESKSKFDPEHFRELLCSAIVVHDLPFRFVEYERIIACFEYLKWDIKLVTRNTMKADILKMYEKEKIVIKSKLGKIPGRLSLTSDCWSSITSDGYISLTCHFIDEDWVLQKFVLNFSLMPSPHTGATLSNKLYSMLCDWGIENKAFSLTLDNAAANDSSVDLLLTQMNLNNSLLCNGEFFHIRCCAHIINLVIQDGLKDINQSVVKVRESVKYVRGSQIRKQKFLECVNKVGLDRKRGLRQDVTTRWNSTFLMLDNALYYKKAFMNFRLSDPNYKLCPSSEEWIKIEKIRGFLSLYYDVSNLFSGSSYPTANLYFRPVVMCYSSLRQSQNSSDEYIKKMAELMLPKFEKYWSDFSMILTIAVVFDPRYKLQFVDFFYKKLYGPNSRQFLLVKEKLFALFEDYCNYYNDKFDLDKNGNSTLSGQNCDFTNADSVAVVEEFNLLDVEFGLSQQKSQLELYMEEKRLDVKSNLDILNYWKGSQYKYPHVACMARDILSIPITTVASESVFSVGGRILDQYRSSLKPSNAEVIICTRDWLFGEKGIDFLFS